MDANVLRRSLDRLREERSKMFYICNTKMGFELHRSAEERGFENNIANISLASGNQQTFPFVSEQQSRDMNCRLKTFLRSD